MDIQQIILGVVVILLLYFLYVYFFSDKTKSTLVDYHDATQQGQVSAASLPEGPTTNYTYSIWFYVTEWNHRYGEEKVIFQRGDSNSNAAPKVYFNPTTNNLHVSLATYSTGSSNESSTMHTCSIENVPLQAWTHLLVTLNNRALDLYLNGKLVRTCVLPGVPKVNPASNLVITPNGGFSGYLSRFQYIANAVNPTQAYNIYKEGHASSSSIFDKYKVKVAFIENNKELNSFMF